MVELRWMTFFVMLQFAAVTGQNSYSVTPRVGDEVTLPCNNVIYNQDKCDQTAWIYSQYKGESAEELISLRQVGNNEMARAKSDRLSVTADCSLVIKNVTRQDVGRYSCRQFNRAGRQQGGEALVLLSVVNISPSSPVNELQNKDRTVLYCTVYTYNECEHTVQWFFEGNNDDIKTTTSPCSAKVIFPTPHVNQKSKFYKSLKCTVTDNRRGKLLLYDVGLDYSLEKTGWCRFIYMSLGLAALIITAVAVTIWTRSKGNTTQMSSNAVHDDEDEGTVTYENVGEPSASIRPH